jgi:DNA-directed RNA polymerase specialized sigma24 family protein
MKKPRSRPPEGSSQWPSTEWSASGHLPALRGKDPGRLNELILKYQPPLKAYLAAAFPNLEPEAGELLQDFTEDKMLKEGWLGRAERNRGRFRDYLKTSLRNFVRDQWRAKKPGMVSMEALGLDPPAEESGSEAFGLEWARTILAQVLERMERDCRKPRGKQRDRLQIWETFRLRLLQPILEDGEAVSYEDLVSKLGIASPAAAQNLLVTAKRIFCRHLNAVIAEYEETGSAATVELEDLRRFLEGLAREKKE